MSLLLSFQRFDHFFCICGKYIETVIESINQIYMDPVLGFRLNFKFSLRFNLENPTLLSLLTILLILDVLTPFSLTKLGL